MNKKKITIISLILILAVSVFSVPAMGFIFTEDKVKGPKMLVEQIRSYTDEVVYDFTAGDAPVSDATITVGKFKYPWQAITGGSQTCWRWANGTVGGCSADADSVVNDAVDSLTDRGGRISVHGGEYEVDNPISINYSDENHNVELLAVGNSRGNPNYKNTTVELKAIADTDIIRITGDASNQRVVGTKIQGFLFDHRNYEGRDINATLLSGTEIRGNQFRNNYCESIYIDGCWDLTIDDNSFTVDKGNYAIHLKSTADRLTSVWVTNNRGGGYGQLLHVAGSAHDVYVTNNRPEMVPADDEAVIRYSIGGITNTIWIEENTICPRNQSHTYYGIWGQSGNGYIMDNHIQGAYKPIKIDSDEFTKIGYNYIHNYSSLSIDITSFTTSLLNYSQTIVGNTFEDEVGTSYAVQTFDNYTTVKNNNFLDTNGVRAKSNAFALRIEGNTFSRQESSDYFYVFFGDNNNAITWKDNLVFGYNTTLGGTYRLQENNDKESVSDGDCFAHDLWGTPDLVQMTYEGSNPYVANPANYNSTHICVNLFNTTDGSAVGTTETLHWSAEYTP